MTMRFGSIIIHKPDPNSETDTGNSSNSEEEPELEIAEIAETAILKYQALIISNKPSKRQNLSNRRSERLKRNMLASTKYRNAIIEGRRSTSKTAKQNELPILQVLDVDKSPPLNHSRYSVSPDKPTFVDDRLKESVNDYQSRRSSISSTSTEDSHVSTMSSATTGSDRLGFRVLTSGSRTSRLSRASSILSTTTTSSTSFAKSSTIVPVSSGNQLEVEDETEVRGLAKLLKNLNFAEKLRQQRAEQERLNIHKLPTHMKEQLKHIYVY